MSQSIGSKLSNLKYKGLITDAEYDRLKKALNSLRVDEMYQLEMEQADQFIPLSVVQEIRQEMLAVKEAEHQIYGKADWQFADKCLEIVDAKIKEYTE